MHAYRDQYAQLFHAGRDVTVLAISTDPLQRLADWARDDDLPFLLASDRRRTVAKRYGATSLIPGVARRSLFVVDRDGRIAYAVRAFRERDPAAYTELRRAIDRLVPGDAPSTG